MPGLDVPKVKDDVEITVNSFSHPDRRPPVMQALGCHVDGWAPPHPDPSDTITMIAGVFKRFGRETPTWQLEKLKRLAAFTLRKCEEWLNGELGPLGADHDLSFETWLFKTNYPEWRRKELMAKWDACDRTLGRKHLNVKSFQKDETYPEFKHARGINARTDEFKCAIGPIFKAIEERVFQLPFFIKKIPVQDRPQYIMDHLMREGCKYLATDYTAFESHFVRMMMFCCEFVLYTYMMQHNPKHKDFAFWMDNVLAGKNHCEYKRFWVEILATRMSGEMNTSLGNGWSNLMLMLFECEEKGCTDVMAVVEGDDGLVALKGEPPTTEDFEKLGWTIKLDVHTDVCKASFCGMVFDPVDKVNVTNPADVILNFGWSNMAYVRCGKVRKLELLRSKALSTAYTYRGAPIIQALAMMGLRVTKHIDLSRFLQKNRSMSMWEREWLMAAMEEKFTPLKVPLATRNLVENLYGIPIEVQIDLERYFDSITSLTPLDHWFFEFMFNKHSKIMWDDYVRLANLKHDFEYPHLRFQYDWNYLLSTHEKHFKKNYAFLNRVVA